MLQKIKGHEKDFLVAHRSQMLKVKEEMKQIRDATSETNLMAIRDFKLQKLEKEEGFFKREAFSLDRNCKEAEKRLKLLKEKVEELEDDRDFHQAQLTKILKVNQALLKYIDTKESAPLALPPSEVTNPVLTPHTQLTHLQSFNPAMTTPGQKSASPPEQAVSPVKSIEEGGEEESE